MQGWSAIGASQNAWSGRRRQNHGGKGRLLIDIGKKDARTAMVIKNSLLYGNN